MENDDIFWHDGNLIGLHFDGIKIESLWIKCALYENPQSKLRDIWEFEITGPSRMIITADIAELSLHRNAGCISDGAIFQHKNGYLLKINLALGYIEVHGDKIIRRKQGKAA